MTCCRTRKQKFRAVALVLLEANLYVKSNRELATVAGVSDPHVGKIRRFLVDVVGIELPINTVGKDGKARRARRATNNSA